MQDDIDFEGELLGQLGIDNVSANNLEWLLQMRMMADIICIKRNCVCVDDLRGFALLLKNKYQLEPKNKNAWGAIFRCGRYVCVDHKVSKHPNNHGRKIGVWVLK